MNYRVKKAITPMYRTSKRLLLNMYYVLTKIKRLIIWHTKQKKVDITIASTLLDVKKLEPIYVNSWHYGSRFCRVLSANSHYFLKIVGDEGLAKREVQFYRAANDNKNLYEKIPKNVRVAQNGSTTYILMEYINAIGLKEAINRGMSVEERKSLVEQIFNLYLELKSCDYLHNDIREENFLYRSGHIFLIDFGYACEVDEKYDFLEKLDTKQRHRRNKRNRIGEDILCDAFSVFNVMKKINPDLYNNQYDIWKSINEYISEELKNTKWEQGRIEVD